jgi:MFS family permease
MVEQSKPNLLLIGLAYLGFVSLGLPDGLLGVAWPSIRTFFGTPLDAVGALLVVFTTGYVLSSFNSGRILLHVNVGSLLALSCLATAVSLLGYALAPFWWIMVAFGVLAGLGAGAIDAGLNTYAAIHHSARSVTAAGTRRHAREPPRPRDCWPCSSDRRALAVGSVYVAFCNPCRKSL